MTAQQIDQAIRDLINRLIRSGLADHQNYPTITTVGQQTHVGISGSPDLSASMKEEAYGDVYNTLRAASAYHIRMVDGALIQMLYCFEKRNIFSHRLAFFPSPTLLSYDEARAVYDDDNLFGDMFAISLVKSPLRFDFSSSDEKFVDVEHPKSHLSLGQYKNCRIPINGPVTPSRFMRFILRNFYYNAYGELNFDALASETAFPETISDAERQILHVVG